MFQSLAPVITCFSFNKPALLKNYLEKWNGRSSGNKMTIFP